MAGLFWQKSRKGGDSLKLDTYDSQTFMFPGPRSTNHLHSRNCASVSVCPGSAKKEMYCYDHVGPGHVLSLRSPGNGGLSVLRAIASYLLC